jgi:hypothetical protein
MSYNGHKNYNHWNVSLWLYNDETFYRLITRHIRRSHSLECATDNIISELREWEILKTPDGAKFTKSAVRAAIRDDWKESRFDV